jgi:hypothetical protein
MVYIDEGVESEYGSIASRPDKTRDEEMDQCKHSTGRLPGAVKLD